MQRTHSVRRIFSRGGLKIASTSDAVPGLKKLDKLGGGGGV